MPRPLIALLTDFGHKSGYVAQMKGVILGLAPEAAVVDITHAIAPQDVGEGAVQLDVVVDAFPPGTLFVAVVDPGVGSARRLIGAEALGRRFLAPDNGLLCEVLAREPPARVHILAEPRFWRQPVSATFHGRDILAPVAASWSLGEDLSAFGPPLALRELAPAAVSPVRVAAAGVAGEIVTIDSFGNLVTNIRGAHVPEQLRAAAIVRVAGGLPVPIVRYYSERPRGELVALMGSSGRLEVAVNGGSAAERLGVSTGAAVAIDFGRTNAPAGTAPAE